MATLIAALTALGFRLVYGRTIELDELAAWTANRSGLTSEEVERVLKAVRSALVHYCRGGAAVRLPGIGRIRPTVDRQGRVRRALGRQLSANGLWPPGTGHRTRAETAGPG